MCCVGKLNRPRAKGFALLAVLWVLVAISTVALAVSVLAHERILVAQNRVDLAKAAWIAEGCADRARSAITDLLNSPGSLREDRWRMLDELLDRSFIFRDGLCDVSLTATGSALDVNRVGAATLRRLFLALDLGEARSDSLTDALLDWRDADDVPRAFGAESSWYESQGMHQPRNGPLANVGELRRVRGFDDVPSLEEVLSTDSGSISINHAPAPVIASLPGIGPILAARIVEARSTGHLVRDLVELTEGFGGSPERLATGDYPDLARAATTTPSTWNITSRARIGTPPATASVELRLAPAGTRTAVVRRRVWVE